VGQAFVVLNFGYEASFVPESKGHFFLRDRHTIFYVYYKRYKFDSMVLLSASIIRPS
jgi:hypothetical protein